MCQSMGPQYNVLQPTSTSCYVISLHTLWFVSVGIELQIYTYTVPSQKYNSRFRMNQTFLSLTEFI